MFLHGGILHLFGNMLYFFIFGDNVEDRFGHLKYFLLYLFFGIAGGLVHSAMAVMQGGSEQMIPAVGASGAISGVLGAYMIFFPNARIVSLFFTGYFIRLVPVPAVFFIGFWFILQFLNGVLGSVTGVAYWAHIGGFLTGALVAMLFKIFHRKIY
jgi:membrane associated rhomboid family serine protease